MTDPDGILRRSLVAIATSSFQGWPDLDGVAEEVASMERWLCDKALGERRFKRRFKSLTELPTRERIISSLTESGGYTATDSLVVYVTSHGQTDHNRNHWTVLHDSEPQRLAWKSLDTAAVIELLTGHEGLDDVMIVLDLCQAGNVSDSISARLRAVLSDRWFIVATSAADRDAKLGAFTDSVTAVLADLRAESGKDAGQAEPYLSSEVFFRRVRDKLRDVHNQNLVPIVDPYRAMTCLPNPAWDPRAGDRVKVGVSRRDLAILDQDMTAHWGPRARGARSEDEPGWLFTGRHHLMRTLVEFTAGPPGTLLVTGRAGCGKSAALARLVTFSDPDFRREYLDKVDHAGVIPAEGAVDVAVLATGKSAAQIAEQIVRGLGGTVPHVPAAVDVQPWMDAILGLVSSGHERTVVIDALDEAADPGSVVQSLLRTLNPPEEPNFRLLVGVRTPGEEISEEQHSDVDSGLGLTDMVGTALAAKVAQADAGEFWVDDDLVRYLTRVLSTAGSTYELLPDTAAVAAKIAQGVGRNYLLGAMVARQLSDAEPLESSSTELEDLLRKGVAELLAGDLTTSLPNPEIRRIAFRLMRAAALARGRGVPWRDLWPELASITGNGGRAIDDEDVAWLLGHRVSGYLVRDLEDGVTVYRPFHDSLRAALADSPSLFVNEGHEEATANEAHDRIARHLGALIRERDDAGAAPPPYARRHLAEHAVETGDADVLQESLDAITLPWLDADSVSRALRLYEAPPNSSLWVLLSAWRGVRNRWSWENAAANAAALDGALLAAAGWTSPRRPPRTGMAWRHRWAHWTWGGTIVGRQVRAARYLSAGTVSGLPVLAVCGFLETGEPHVQLWEASTGLPVGPPLFNIDEIGPVVMATVHGRALVAAADRGAVNVWEASTGALLVRVTDVSARWLALGEAGATGLLAGAAGNNDLWVYDLLGRVRLADLPVSGAVRGLAFAQDPPGRLIAGIADYPDSRIEHLDAFGGTPLRPSISLVGEVNAVAWARGEYGSFLAAGTARGMAQVFNDHTGEPEGPPLDLGGEVRSVALDVERHSVRMAAGGFDSAAEVINTESGETLSMTHPDHVYGVAFSRVEGRSMVATVCADGNARLWDSAKPSGARLSARESVETMSMMQDGDGTLVAGGGKHLVTVWDGADGESVFEDVWERDDFRIKGNPEPVSVALGRVAERPVLLAGTGTRVVLVDLQEGTVRAESRRPANNSGWHWTPSLHVGHGGAYSATVEEDSVLIVDLAADRREVRIKVQAWGTDAYLVGCRDRLLLASATDNGTSLWDALTGVRAGVLPVLRWSRVRAGEIGGREVLVWTDHDLLHLWDLAKGSALRPPITLVGSTGPPILAAVGGRDLALVKHEQTVRAYHLGTGRVVAELPFGTSLRALGAVSDPASGRAIVGIGGPGVMVTELWDPSGFK